MPGKEKETMDSVLGILNKRTAGNMPLGKMREFSETSIIGDLIEHVAMDMKPGEGHYYQLKSISSFAAFKVLAMRFYELEERNKYNPIFRLRTRIRSVKKDGERYAFIERITTADHKTLVWQDNKTTECFSYLFLKLYARHKENWETQRERALLEGYSQEDVDAMVRELQREFWDGQDYEEHKEKEGKTL